MKLKIDSTNQYCSFGCAELFSIFSHVMVKLSGVACLDDWCERHKELQEYGSQQSKRSHISNDQWSRSVALISGFITSILKSLIILIILLTLSRTISSQIALLFALNHKPSCGNFVTFFCPQDFSFSFTASLLTNLLSNRSIKYLY